MSDQARQWKIAVAAYLLLAAPLCFWRLGATGLVSMEGMVSDGAQHMIESGDWVVPRVYGEIYTYKPALAYWLAALPHALADQPSEWLLRLPFAASGFAMGLALLFLIGRVAGPQAGLITALASVSTGLFIQKVRIAEYDTALAAGVGVAVAAAACNLATARARTATWALGYLGLTFAFLAKGTPALMAYGPGLLAAAVLTRRWRRLLEVRHVVPAMLCAAAIGAYLLLAFQSAGPQAFAQPLAEAKLRGVGWWLEQSDGVQPGMAVVRSALKPVYILGAFLPWSLLLPLAFRTRARDLASEPSRHLLVAAKAFLVAGALAFMVTPTHEVRYYLPLVAPAGILCGLVAAARLEARWHWHPTLTATAAYCVFVAGAIAVGTLFWPVDAWQAAVLLVLALLILSAIRFTAHSTLRRRAVALTTVAALGTLFGESLGLQQWRAKKRVLEPQAAEVARLVPEGEALWVQGPSDMAGKSASLYFYLDRPVLAFGADGQPPPEGSTCLLTSDRLAELEDVPDLVFEETARISHVSREYLVGRCYDLQGGGLAAGRRQRTATAFEGITGGN